MGLLHVGSNQALPLAGGLRAGGEPFLTREGLERDLLCLYEQLLATRLELIDDAVPAAGQLTLSRGELDCVLAQLDSAIISARHMVSSAVRVPEEARVFDIRPAYGPRDGTYYGARVSR
jgi:hypothetical protein